MVKAGSLTIELPLILFGLSTVEVVGMSSVAVKCIDITQNTDCEGRLLTDTDAEARKCGDQTGLDTLVVHTVNVGYSMRAINCACPSESDKYPTWEVRPQG